MVTVQALEMLQKKPGYFTHAGNSCWERKREHTPRFALGTKLEGQCPGLIHFTQYLEVKIKTRDGLFFIKISP